MLGPILILLGVALSAYLVKLEIQQIYIGPKLSYEFLPWGEKFIKDLVHQFLIEWTAQYPRDKIVLTAALNKLNIHWQASRLKLDDGSPAFGISPTPNKMMLWVGPRIRGKDRSILNTALLSQLALLAVSVTNRDPSFVNSGQVKEILRATATFARNAESSL